ncbi:MAG: 6-carboxytetrahydropterin synthase QueD [Thiotrichales bacterium]|jgi:6-pyruvoyltetrahydropterin/6-carboxytetrahydropterin synthase|nr:6-carboxytetrahydropterin synthase QueD [Thiotrichales bacterium]
MAFTLTTHLEFAAAHRLRGYEGNCERLHGHNWKVAISVSGHELNEVGMLIDFKEIKRKGKMVLNQLDHFYLNDIPPFDAQLNPTAENIAFYLFEQLAQQINDDRIRITAITVWENDRNSATYSHD